MFQRGCRDWPRESGGCRPEDSRWPGAHHRPRGKGGAVNGTPKLTPWRHLKSDPLGGLVDLCWIFWFWCPGRRGGLGMVVSVLAGGGRNAPQIAVFKPVAVPFKRENLRVM